MSPDRSAKLRRRLDALGLRTQARLDAQWADRSLPWVLAAVMFGLLLATSLAVVRQLDGGPGLALWSQAAWHLRAGHAPVSSIAGANPAWREWSFVSYPVLWLTRWVPSAQVFAGVQALALALAVIPLWRLARTMFDLRVGTTAAVIAAYALAPAIHSVNLSPFHPEVIAIPAFAWAILFWRRSQWIPFALCIAVMLLSRADIGVTVAALGILLVLDGDRWPGLATIIGGLGWTGAAIAVLNPKLPTGTLTAGQAFLAQGTVPLAEVRTLFTDPGQVFGHLAGQQTVLVAVALTAPLLFLSFAAPRTLIPALPGFVFGTAAGDAVQNASEAGVPHSVLGAGRVVITVIPITLAGLVALHRIGRRSETRVNVDHRLVGAMAIASVLFFVQYAPSSPYEHPWDWGSRDATDEARLDAVHALPGTEAITVSPQLTAEVADRVVVDEAWLGPPTHISAWHPTTAAVILAPTGDDDNGDPLWIESQRQSMIDSLEVQGYELLSSSEGILSFSPLTVGSGLSRQATASGRPMARSWSRIRSASASWAAGSGCGSALAKDSWDRSWNGTRWTWVCGTSSPTTSTPTLSGWNVASRAWPIVWLTDQTCAARSAGRSIQCGISSIGITMVCPGARGLMVRMATQRSSRHTKRPGISPSMIRVKMVGIAAA